MVAMESMFREKLMPEMLDQLTARMAAMLGVSLPNAPLPIPPSVHMRGYMGCYKDDDHRDLQDRPKLYGFTVDTCAKACEDYLYFALQNGGHCMCGNAYATEAKYAKRPDSECNKGFKRGGGSWRNAVFEVPVNKQVLDEFMCFPLGW